MQAFHPAFHDKAIKMRAFHYIYVGATVMRSPRKSTDEQYKLIMEWCNNWVKQLRKLACYEIPAATGRDKLTAPVKQKVVKVDIVPDLVPVRQDSVLPTFRTYAPEYESEAVKVPIQIWIHDAVFRITNDGDPRFIRTFLGSAPDIRGSGAENNSGLPY